MKKTALALIATASVFALAACGNSDSASEDVMADSVEMPAEDAMADTPEPLPVPAAPVDTAATDAAEPAAAALTVDEISEAAEQAARDVEAATKAAEDAM